MSMRILIVIPCLNEAEHLQGLVEALLPAARRLNGAILIADGGSTDGTREIAARLAEKDTAVLVLDNPKHIQSAAINLAVARHGADHVARLQRLGVLALHQGQIVGAGSAKQGLEVGAQMVRNGHWSSPDARKPGAAAGLRKG